MVVRVKAAQLFFVGLSVLASASAVRAQTPRAPAGEDAAEAYPEEIPVNPSDDRERFAASNRDNWGIPEALELYQRSEELYDEGRYQEAAAYLLRVIELDPTAPELYYNIALVYEHLQEYDRALEFLERYSQLGIEAAEQRRVERMMIRIRGAREHLPPSPRPQSRTRVVVQRFGRADGLFWGMIGATILFAAGAAITGGLALDWANASEQFTVGLDGDLADYRQWVNVSDSLALTTDILIGVASASALTALLLYVLRTHPAIEVQEVIDSPSPGDDSQPAGTESGAPEVEPAGDDVESDEDGALPDDEETLDDGYGGLGAPRSRRAGRLASRPLVGLGIGAVILEWEF